MGLDTDAVAISGMIMSGPGEIRTRDLPHIRPAEQTSRLANRTIYQADLPAHDNATVQLGLLKTLRKRDEVRYISMPNASEILSTLTNSFKNARPFSVRE